MADDYDNTDDIENLSDDELCSYVLQELRSQNAFDVDDLTLSVEDGMLTLSGRVGTEEELRIIDHVVTDVLGLIDADNQVVVDELRRAESPMAIDDHLVDESQSEGLLLGDRAVPFSPEAEHLADSATRHDPEDQLTDELASEVRLDDDGGTRDVQQAIEGAEPWIPPDSPTPEGVSGQEEGRFGIDGQH
jgi:BON domain